MRNVVLWVIVVFVVQDALYHMLEWLERRESRKRLGEIRDRVSAMAQAFDVDRQAAATRIQTMLDVVDAMRLQVMMLQELSDERPHHGDTRTH